MKRLHLDGSVWILLEKEEFRKEARIYIDDLSTGESIFLSVKDIPEIVKWLEKVDAQKA